MMPVVSVIMPVYNTEKYVSEAIKSILNQTFSDFEFIIIDDGSTDKSLAVIESFTDVRIRLIKNNENKGIVFSLNKGVGLAHGKYIARMDADDVSLPKRLTKQVAFLDKNLSIDVVGGSVEIVKNSLRLGREYDIRDFRTEQVNCALLFTCPLYHPTVMCRAVVMKNNLYSNYYPFSEDWELWTRIAKKHRMASISAVILKYRIHQNNCSRNNNALITSSLISLFKNELFYHFGITDSNQIETHFYYCAGGYSNIVFEKSSVQTCKSWLITLRGVNKEKLVFPTVEFEEAISNAWFRFWERNLEKGKLNIIDFLMEKNIHSSFIHKKRLFFHLLKIYLKQVLQYFKAKFSYSS